MAYQASGHAAKRAIRKRWAKETFAHVLLEKDFVESHKDVDITLGKYFTLGGLVIEFGGWSWPPAVLGAKLHFLKADLKTSCQQPLGARVGQWGGLRGRPGRPVRGTINESWKGPPPYNGF
jgi:hypothetical protein